MYLTLKKGEKNNPFLFKGNEKFDRLVKIQNRYQGILPGACLSKNICETNLHILIPHLQIDRP